MMIFMQLILWKTFFGQCSQHDDIGKFKDALSEDIFACMELSKQSYVEVCSMPVKRFFDYLKWKSKLEEEKQKKMAESMGKD